MSTEIDDTGTKNFLRGMIKMIRALPGQPDSRCQEFLQMYWPEVNQGVFGWEEQERWSKVYTTLLAEVNGQILGAAIFWQMGGVGYLSQLLVKPDSRGQGIGRKLMNSFEGECALCHKLALKTYKDSPSQRFYEYLGYTVEAVVKQDIHGIDWVYMRKGGSKNEGQ